MATILVVDDDSAVREYLVELLGERGHRLLEAADGGQALALVRAERPHLIMADILMPMMDGYEFVRQLRADPTIAQTPVILYSGVYLEREAEALARAYGVVQVITKPFAPEVVLSAVDEVLGRTGLPSALPSPSSNDAFEREHLRLLTYKLSQKVKELEEEAARRKRAEEALAAETCFLRAQIAVAQVALSNLRSEALLPKLLEAVAGAQGYTSGFIYRLAEGERVVTIVANFGEGTASFLGSRRDLSDPKSFVALVIRTGQPIFVNRAQENLLGAHPIIRTLGTQAFIGLPLLQRTDKMVGVMTFGDTENPERFTERDLMQGEVLAGQVAQALGTSELFSQVQQLEERYRVVTESLNDAVYTVDMEGRVMFCNPTLARLTGYRTEELLGHFSEKFYGTEVHRLLRDRRLQAFGGRPVPPHVEADLTRKDGVQVPVELSAANLVVAGRIVGRVVVIRDLTERKQAEAAIEQRRQEAEVMAELARTICASLDLSIILQQVVEGAQRLCESDNAAIALRNTGSEAMVVRHMTGVRYQACETIHIQPGEGIGGIVLATGRPCRTEHYAEDPRGSKAHIEVIQAEGVESLMAVPIRIGARTEGVVYVANRVTRPFTDRDERILQRLAAYAAIAIHNAHLYGDVSAGRERLRALSHRLVEAQEAERLLIARELHDEVGQALTAVKINLQAIQRLPGASAVGAHLEESMDIVEYTLQHVRNLSLDLRPALLDDLGLVAALRWYVDRQAQRTEFAATFAADPIEIRLSPDIEIVCFRVAQEALTNIARHARARRVWVTLRRSDTELHLVIRDDGVGFDVRTAWEHTGCGGNLGLLGMQERVELVGGQLEITSAPARGTEIHARFPLLALPSHPEGTPKEKDSS